MDALPILRLAQMCCPFYNSTVFHAECLVFLSLVCMEYISAHTHTHTHTHIRPSSPILCHGYCSCSCVSPAQKRDQNMNFTFPVPLPPNTHAICRFQKLLFVFVVSSAPITHRFCFNFERGPLLLEIPSVCRNLSPL